jgi:hypothetical protein
MFRKQIFIPYQINDHSLFRNPKQRGVSVDLPHIFTRIIVTSDSKKLKKKWNLGFLQCHKIHTQCRQNWVTCSNVLVGKQTHATLRFVTFHFSFKGINANFRNRAELRLSLFLNVRRRRLAASHRRFGTAYRFHLQRSSWITSPLNMGTIECPERSVTSYQPTPHNIPQERRPPTTPQRKTEFLQVWNILMATWNVNQETGKDNMQAV